MAFVNETNIDLIMINKIKQHQVLYDTDEDQYKYIDKRDKAWKEVSDELGMPGKYTQCVSLIAPIDLKFAIVPV